MESEWMSLLLNSDLFDNSNKALSFEGFSETVYFLRNICFYCYSGFCNRCTHDVILRSSTIEFVLRQSLVYDVLFVLMFLAPFQIKPPLGELFEVAGTLCQIILFRFIDTEGPSPPSSGFWIICYVLRFPVRNWFYWAVILISRIIVEYLLKSFTRSVL